MTTFRKENGLTSWHPPPSLRGQGCVLSQCFCLHVGLHFFHFNLICNTLPLSEKKKIFDLFSWWSMLNSLLFDKQHDYFQKRKWFDLLTPPPQPQRCVLSQCFCLHVGLHFFHFNLICNTLPLSEKKKIFDLFSWWSMLNTLLFDKQHDYFQKRKWFDLLTPPPPLFVGKIFANMLLNAPSASKLAKDPVGDTTYQISRR